MVEGKYQHITVGDWTVEPGLDRLRQGGAEVSLEPRHMDVLMYLAARPGEVVSADELIAEVWQGVVVGDDAVYHCISRLREALGDDSHHPTYIETIAKRGYRLIAPVRFVKEQEGRPYAPEMVLKTTGGGRRKVLALTGVLALGLLIVGYQYLNGTRTPTPPLAERSIAVLPFADLSPQGDQEYFADGIAEDLLNALARVPQLKVTGRTSSFTFRDRNEDVRVIGEVLGVAHVLEGSVRRDGNRVRVTAQLLDTADGFHLWSATYDRELADIFAVQDEIAGSIVEALKKRLGIEVESAPRVAAAANAEAYVAYLLGVHRMEKRGAGPLAEAAAHFEQALEIDPGYAPALARLGMTYLLLSRYSAVNYPQTAMRQQALPLIDRALALAPDLPESQAAKGYFHFRQMDFTAAEPYFRRAIQLNPSYATVYSWLGNVMRVTLRFDEALAWRKKSVRADPLSPLALHNMIDAYGVRNMIRQAQALFPRLQQVNPGLYERQSYFFAKRQGRLADAAVSLLKILAIDPNQTTGHAYFPDILTNAFGLYRDDLRFGYMPASAHIALGQTEEALEFARQVIKRDPGNVGGLALAGRIYAAAGERQAARQILEQAWQMIPDGPGKVTAFNEEAQLVLIALRLDVGERAGAKVMIDSLREAAGKFEAAGIAGVDGQGGIRWANGVLQLFEGREEEAKASLTRALDGGYVPGILDLHLLERFPAIDASALLADHRARMAVERDKFLAIICNGGNPAPEVWTPLPETCQGYVEG